MFEKIKEKAKNAKNWVVEHKIEIGVGVLGVVTGAVSVIIADRIYNGKAIDRIHDYIETCEPGENLLVDVIRVEEQSDNYYWAHGDINNPTLENLSADLIQTKGANKDEKVIGALVYTKKQ